MLVSGRSCNVKRGKCEYQWIGPCFGSHGGRGLGPEPLKTSRVQRKKMERRLDGSFIPMCLSLTPNPHGKRGGVCGFDDSLASFPFSFHRVRA